ncbi:hypothetical protein [Acinetobacter sp. YH01009]|uniref:hypothetical protein n=1 Tax=Acinetobacter TaxID=469 RepID=UPI0015D31628|nr:hypothetical protein [Acinetobacter sp. YH01009]
MLFGSRKEIVSHFPLVSIYNNSDTLTVSVDTDSEDLNRQPKNIKIAASDIQELTMEISGFEELENQEGGRFFSCLGKVELVNSLPDGNKNRYTLAEPNIKVHAAKKGHLPPAPEIKQLVRNAWLDAYSDACQNLNTPAYYNEESRFQRFKNSTAGKFLMILFSAFIVIYLALAIFGYVKSKNAPVDPTVAIANQIANDPQAAQQLLNQLEQQQQSQTATPGTASTTEQAAEQERREEISSFGLDPGVSDE